MARVLTDAARRTIVAFEDATGARATDCLVEDDRFVIVVKAGQMGRAIGPDGRTIQSLEARLGRSIRLVEDGDTPAAFVANAMAPAAVENVTISRGDETIAYVEVAPDDVGVAIGRNGRTIETARRLVARRFDVDEIQIL